MTAAPASRVLLVGCGKMGSALLQGMRAAHHASRIVVIDPLPRPAHILQSPELVWLVDSDAIDPFFQPDAVILAVKPQQLAALLPAYARFRHSLFISIAAGATLTQLAALLGGDHAIIRTMPNLPASIGEGISVAVANIHATPAQCALADTLLQAIGEVEWIAEEQLLDAVTALSGSGPAYVFALCEAMAAGGAALGLPTPLAEKLARQTVTGSGALLKLGSQTAAQLRKAVTSPGGTTAAALMQLCGKDGLNPLMARTMAAAAVRAAELAEAL